MNYNTIPVFQFTYHMRIALNEIKLDIQGDPQEPDILKINSTQLFFK